MTYRERPPAEEPYTWRYKTWTGSTSTVVASTVEFTGHHVVWRDQERFVVLAEHEHNVNELTQIGHLGSATRGVRGSDTDG